MVSSFLVKTMGVSDIASTYIPFGIPISLRYYWRKHLILLQKGTDSIVPSMMSKDLEKYVEHFKENSLKLHTRNDAVQRSRN